MVVIEEAPAVFMEEKVVMVVFGAVVEGEEELKRVAPEVEEVVVAVLQQLRQKAEQTVKYFSKLAVAEEVVVL